MSKTGHFLDVNWLVQVIFPTDRQLRNLGILGLQHLSSVLQNLSSRSISNQSQCDGLGFLPERKFDADWPS